MIWSICQVLNIFNIFFFAFVCISSHSILQELASHGHKATLIPVLSFKFVSLNTLLDKVNYTAIHQYKLKIISVLVFHILSLFFV